MASRRRTKAPLTLLACLAALAALPPAARAEGEQAPGAGGTLAVAADPPRLVLGRDAAAELRIAAPAGVEELEVTASLGKVDGLRRLPGGGFSARYHPPAERYPQVAIVAAIGRGPAGPADGWLAIPLAGQADARVRCRPGQEVTLRVEGRSFGPARAGADGLAVLPVVIPPGVKELHRGFTPVPVRVPETTLLHAALDRRAVQADRAEAVRVLVYVVAPHGAARKGEPPVVEASRGSVSALQPREPGAWEGTWTLPPGSAGEERLSVRLPGLPASRATLRLQAAAGPPAALSVAFDRPALVAGEGGEALVTVRSADAAGNPSPARLALSTDLGALGPVEEAGPGLARARLRVAPSFGGREQLQVTARALGTGAAASAPLQLAPAPAARAALLRAPVPLPADERAEVELELRAWDRWDNPASGSPTARSTNGDVGRPEPVGPGRWTLRFRPAPVDGPVQARVVAELAGAEAAEEVLLVPAPERRLALVLGGGVLAGRVGGGQLQAGLELPAAGLPRLSGRLASAWRLELEGIAAGRDAAGGAERLRLAALLGGPEVVATLPGSRWFASGTAGILLGRDDRPQDDRLGAALAGRLAVGVAMPLRRLSPYLELGLLGAGGLPGGAFTSLQLSLGVRLDTARGPAAGQGE
jgi:hypothetical protein